ncbi:hypothetical protein GOQ27_10415 [Clostridium sp. D2Q-11]|uniref:SHOCT domain-containing protein n=1 Tax=Anaeromonas frigoriresistens TaxID=2683708 RepID=A0A942Z9H5_9FIRM|nr:hypothetical protein [Anaeromonas frigoriresistens]MBS4538880.1 hypothetical protein [Anaeromonas frigoriresistens]
MNIIKWIFIELLLPITILKAGLITISFAALIYTVQKVMLTKVSSANQSNDIIYAVTELRRRYTAGKISEEEYQKILNGVTK